MSNPASVPAAIPRLEKKYKAPESAPAFLLEHVKPDSAISSVEQRRFKGPNLSSSVPPERDGKRLDNLGRRISTLAATTIKTANALAILGRYDRQMWNYIVHCWSSYQRVRREWRVRYLKKES